LKDIRKQATRVVGDYVEKLEEEKNKGEKQKEKITELEAQIHRLRDNKQDMYDITQ
jgi:cell division protein FtsB